MRIACKEQPISGQIRAAMQDDLLVKCFLLLIYVDSEMGRINVLLIFL